MSKNLKSQILPLCETNQVLCLGKILYAVIFCVALPVGLAFWAHATNVYFPPPPIENVSVGAVLLVAGIALIAASMLALYIHGRGLPMNGYPPPVYVMRGPYRLMRHPIYVGFCVACAGAAIMSKSGSGFWLVLPTVIAGTIALVWGLERPGLQRRFGPLPDQHEPFFRIPKNTADVPGIADRVSAGVLIFVPWGTLGIVSGYFLFYVGFLSPFEQNEPVDLWGVILDASGCLLLLLSILLAPTRAALRNFMQEAIIAMFALFSLLLLILHTAVSSYVFPPVHVLFALIAMTALMKRGVFWRWLASAWTIAIAIFYQILLRYAIALEVHSEQSLHMGLATAILLYLAVRNRIRLFRACVRVAERLANSLRTWRVGPLRIFNHAVYSGSAAFFGVLIAGIFTGTSGLCAVGITGVCTLVGGALWAQFVEGSPTLLRPFGYYGAILGGVIGALLAPLTGADTLVLLAAFATASPVIVAIGRLRCLVQGCCHGRPLDSGMDAALGLRVTNPSSRVCLMSPFAGKPIHATPLYAIAANAVIALILLCLWSGGARLTLILGLYFLLAGLSRFVEEAYRGESQTRVWKRLTEYQWYAVVFVIAGATVTALPCAATPPTSVFTGHTVGVAAALGLLTAFAMSMDFPDSTRRFSRLTG
jgi:protein-S-isoprenylcysteine O-methyltransferase Ste14